MRIVVVKTCDGPVYYSANRLALKHAAAKLATDQVIHHNGDHCDYDDHDVAEIKRLSDSDNWRALYEELMTIGALREAYVIDAVGMKNFHGGQP